MMWFYVASDLLSIAALVTSIWAVGRARAALRRIQAIRAAMREPVRDAQD